MSNSIAETTTSSATFRGIQLENGAAEYRGIRYATASRFNPPVDVVETGVVDAVAFGPICPQLPGALETMVSVVEEMNEDCHFLNVYVPSGTTPKMNLPVLVWIHGGAYTNGSGSLSWYNGTSLASRQCIVVTVNYRLGIFGFLGDGNLGTQDMVSALRWVNKNISSFGGDAANVTIFGESAGGSAVISLMACDAAKSLFHHVWALSPSIGQLRDIESANHWLKQNLTVAKVSSVDEFQSLTTEQLLSIQGQVLTLSSKNFDMYTPTAGGAMLDADILSRAASDERPVVIGTNRDENKLWSAFDTSLDNASTDHWDKFLNDTFHGRAGRAKDAYESLRPGDSVKNLCSAVQTDVSFRSRAISLAERRAVNGSPTWMYWFTWQSPAFGGILGCCHALDIPFAFDNLHQDGAEMFTGPGEDRQGLATSFAGFIAEFAQQAAAPWKQYDLNTRTTMVIDASCTTVEDPESDIRVLFAS